MTFGGDGAKKRLGKSKLVKSHSQSRRKKWSQDQMQETHTAFQKTPFHKTRFRRLIGPESDPRGNNAWRSLLEL
jgi:hypothetical protein